MSESEINVHVPKKAKIDEAEVVNNSKSVEGSTDPKTDAAAKAGVVNDKASPEAAKLAEELLSPKEARKTPFMLKIIQGKRTPSKRLSFIERAQKESEELVKTMGGTLELEGGRRTRSSARGSTGTPVQITPPMAKKPRVSPGSASSTGTPAKGRGRGVRKINVTTPPEEGSVQAPEKPPAEEAAAAAEEKPAAAEPSKDETSALNENAASETTTEKIAAAVESVEKVAKVTKGKTSAPSEAVLKSAGSDDNQAVSTEAVLKKSSEDKTDSSGVVAAAPSDSKSNIKDVEEVKLVTEVTKVKEDVTVTAMEVDNEPQAEIASEPETAKIEKKVEQASAVTHEEKVEKVNVDENGTHDELPKAVAVEKQPTPEPMDVDSGSSSDVQKIIQNEPVHEVLTSVVNNELNDDRNDTSNKIEIKAQEVGTRQDNISILKQSGIVGSYGVQTQKIENEVHSKAPVVSTGIKNASVVNESKTEHELGEPKINSPSIPTTNDGVVSTPPFCN